MKYTILAFISLAIIGGAGYWWTHQEPAETPLPVEAVLSTTPSPSAPSPDGPASPEEMMAQEEAENVKALIKSFQKVCAGIAPRGQEKIESFGMELVDKKLHWSKMDAGSSFAELHAWKIDGKIYGLSTDNAADSEHQSIFSSYCYDAQGTLRLHLDYFHDFMIIKDSEEWAGMERTTKYAADGKLESSKDLFNSDMGPISKEKIDFSKLPKHEPDFKSVRDWEKIQSAP